MKVILVDKVKELNLYRITKEEWKRTLVVEEKDFNSFDIFGMAFYYEQVKNYWIIRTTSKEVIEECKKREAKFFDSKTSISWPVKVSNQSEKIQRLIDMLFHARCSARDNIAIQVYLGLNLSNQSGGTYIEKDIMIRRAILHAIAIIRNPDLFFAIQEEEEKKEKAWLERTVKEEQEEKQEKSALDIIKEKLIEIIDILKTKEKE